MKRKDGKRLLHRTWKWFVVFFCFCILLLLPLLIEDTIKHGIFGYIFFDSIFSQEQWFSFWGSYSGSIITCIILFLTIRYNKMETKKMLRSYEIDRKYNELLDKLKDIHLYINFKDYIGNRIDNISIIYYLKLLDGRYFALMKECQLEIKEMDNDYLEITNQMFYEYLLVADKMPKTLDDIDIKEAKQIYLECTKEITSIYHKYVQEEASAYDKIVKIVEDKRILEKRNIFLE